MFQIPGAGRLWQALTGGGTNLAPAAPTSPGTNVQPNFGITSSYPQPTKPYFSVDEVLQQVWPQPWYGSGDLDPIDGGAPENRACYLALYKKEPRLNAAIEGKVASIASLKVSVRGADEDDPRDVEAAQFIDACIRQSQHGSWISLLASILRPGLVYGWSAGEITLGEITTGKYIGKWGLKHVRNLNTEPFIKLQLDVYRNITGVVNLIRGIQDYDPKKFVFYANKPIFGNPFGQSDVQPAQRAAMLFREVYQVWYVALKQFGLPYMHGKVSNPSYRKALEGAMQAIRGDSSGGWAVTSKEDEIEVLDLAASAAANGFEAMIDKLSEDIFFGVRGSSTPSQVSSNKGGDNRGNTETSKQTGQDPIEKLAAEELIHCINRHLIPRLMEPNFPPDVGMPYLTIGDANEEDTEKKLKVIAVVENELHRPVSTEEIYKLAGVKPADPADPDDAKVIQRLQAESQQAAMTPGGGMPGSPGEQPGGGPPQLPPGPDGGTPPKPPAPPSGGAPNPLPAPGAKPAPPRPNVPSVAPPAASPPPALPAAGGATLPPELVVAILEAAAEGDWKAVDGLTELGEDAEGLAELLGDREAGTYGAMTTRAFAAMGRNFAAGVRTFSWFHDPTPRSKSRITNSESGDHAYGDTARRIMEAQGRTERGEPHPETPKQALQRMKAEREPAREAARQAYQKALNDPGSLTSKDLEGLRDHLHTLTRDEVRQNLRQVMFKAGGKLKADLVDGLLEHVRGKAIEHHESKLDPLSMGMDQDIAQNAIADLQGTALPARKMDRDPDKEAAHLAKNDHNKRREERNALMNNVAASDKTSHGTPDTGSKLKQPDKMLDVRTLAPENREGLTLDQQVKKPEEQPEPASKQVTQDTPGERGEWGDSLESEGGAASKQGGTGVKSGSVASIPIDKITFPGGLSDEVTPLKDNSDQPVIVMKKGDKYQIVDGFGRASGIKNGGGSSLHAIIVSDEDLATNPKGPDTPSDDEQWVAEMHHKYSPKSRMAVSKEEWSRREVQRKKDQESRAAAEDAEKAETERAAKQAADTPVEELSASQLINELKKHGSPSQHLNFKEYDSLLGGGEAGVTKARDVLRQLRGSSSLAPDPATLKQPSQESPNNALPVSEVGGPSAASSVKGAASAPTGWVGDDLLLINHAYKHLKDTDPAYKDMTLDQFKDNLIRDNGKGVTLSRADLPQALDANDVRESEVQHPAMKGRHGGDFHFIKVPRASSGQKEIPEETGGSGVDAPKASNKHEASIRDMHNRGEWHPGKVHEAIKGVLEESGADGLRDLADRLGVRGVRTKPVADVSRAIREWLVDRQEAVMLESGSHPLSTATEKPAGTPAYLAMGGPVGENVGYGLRTNDLAKKLGSTGKLTPTDAVDFANRNGDRYVHAGSIEATLTHKLGVPPEEAKKIMASLKPAKDIMVGTRKQKGYDVLDAFRAAGKLAEAEPPKDATSAHQQADEYAKEAKTLANTKGSNPDAAMAHGEAANALRGVAKAHEAIEAEKARRAEELAAPQRVAEANAKADTAQAAVAAAKAKEEAARSKAEELKASGDPKANIAKLKEQLAASKAKKPGEPAASDSAVSLPASPPPPTPPDAASPAPGAAQRASLQFKNTSAKGDVYEPATEGEALSAGLQRFAPVSSEGKVTGTKRQTAINKPMVVDQGDSDHNRYRAYFPVKKNGKSLMTFTNIGQDDFATTVERLKAAGGSADDIPAVAAYTVGTGLPWADRVAKYVAAGGTLTPAKATEYESATLEGNTYPVRQKLAAIPGAKYDPQSKTWSVPFEHLDEANKLIASAKSAPGRYVSWKGDADGADVYSALSWDALRVELGEGQVDDAPPG